MDLLRAHDIASSPSMVDVTYNGAPIYIEQVHDESNTVTVHFLDKPEEKHTVSVTHLLEI
ncbi:small, acid-soluble spore protein, H family [Desulfuribacillus stibiiarsenatis]|uniref:Small, acid-soluble spore protein, H family n=1 Tax=Desulfuribacillus stibiiarsenatis TaxID=1390249 RepID=A0A1E5L4S9_9FIRM|nr:H-type small acid-soluble spore protein [Desulfuribacillus stibiiarsenatis]OEH85135.1 small, acid-soluble spore protein, H family [Desulfuribacillus stibiiarsenatis]